MEKEIIFKNELGKTGVASVWPDAVFNKDIATTGCRLLRREIAVRDIRTVLYANGIITCFRMRGNSEQAGCRSMC